jgi:hypothetical protein
MHQPRQRAAVQQRQRGAQLAAQPQIPNGGADIVGQAVGADVELAHVARQVEACGTGAAALCERACDEPQQQSDADRAQHPHHEAARFAQPAEELAQPALDARQIARLARIAPLERELAFDAVCRQIRIGAQRFQGGVDRGR